MMEFIDVIKARTSVREYSEKQVEAEKITYVLGVRTTCTIME